MAAQGSVLIFIAILVVYATAMKRLAPGDALPEPGSADVCFPRLRIVAAGTFVIGMIFIRETKDVDIRARD
jgi:hypothetical protein